jgi:glyoxylase-like metal-dependent hydrolase (beta-lactamase superfamily II)
MAEMQRYGNNCNSYIIANALPEKKHIIFDPGQVVNEVGQPCLDRLVDEMKKDGIRMEDTGLIINTHAHPDHYGASQTIKKMSGALITISERDDKFLSEMKRQFSKQIEMMGLEMPEVGADFYLWEGQLNLGEGLMLEILPTPGHSPGHVSIYWPEIKVLIGGDLIFHGSTGRVDLPGGSASLLKESIDRVSHWEIDYLLTGHQYGSPGIIQERENIKRNFDFVRTNVFPYL